MAKFRPRSGGRLPQRSGGSRGGQLKSSVDGVTSALQTQRQAWTEVIGSLNEYRSVELPDFSLTVPDISGWQSLTAEVKAYSAAIAAIPTPTVATFSATQQPGVSESSTTTATAMTADSTDAIAATNAAILEQTEAWKALAASRAAATDTTSEMSDTREQLNQTITTIHRQESSWKSLAAAVIGTSAKAALGILSYATSKNALAIANANAARTEIMLAAATANAAAAQSVAATATAGQTAATIFAIPPTFTLAGAMAVLMAPVTLIVGGLALAAAAIYYFTRSSKDATDATTQSGDAAESSAKKAGSLSLAYKEVAKQAKNIESIQAAKQAKEKDSGLSAMQTAKQSVKGGVFPENTDEQLQVVAKEAGKVVLAWGELKATIQQPVVDAGMALGRYAVELLGVKSAAESATATLRKIGEALEWTKNKSKEYSTALSVMAYMMATGSTEAEAKAYVEQGQKILEKSARIQAMTDRLERQRASYKQYKAQVAEAEESVKHHADVSAIANITTLEGIEKAREALKRRTAEEAEWGAKKAQLLSKQNAPQEKYDALNEQVKEQGQKRLELIKGYGEQEAAIKAGRVESGVDAATRKTTEAIAELTLGHTENTIAVMRAEAAQKGQLAAFEAGLPAYREAQAQLAATKEATDAKKKADEEAARAIQKVADANKSAAEKIENVKDRIAILNGTMTEAGVAMKAMQAIGINPDLAAETAKVNAEFEKLTTAKKGTDQITALRDQIDLLNGSATAAQIKMRELGREGFSEEQVAQIGALTAELDTLKDSKKTKSGSKDKDTSAPAFAGSKEAAEIMLRGVGGGSRMESLAAQQLAELKRINAQKQPLPTSQPVPPPVVPKLTVPPMPAPAEIPAALAGIVPPVAPNMTPEAVASLPEPADKPADKQATQAERIAEADASRERAEKAATRAGLNAAQITQAGQDAWDGSERDTAPRMDRFKPADQRSPQPPTNPPLVPPAASLTATAPPATAAPVLIPPKTEPIKVQEIKYATAPTPKSEPVEVQKSKPSDVSKVSGVSAKVEQAMKSGPGGDGKSNAAVEKLLTMQVAELKANTAAVKANKPQMMSSGTV